MRRFAFYFAVALVTFGIGSFLVFKLYFKPAEHFVIFQTTKINRSENNEQILTSIPQNFHSKEINYEEWGAFEVLKPTIRKWLRSEKINRERQEVSDEVIREVTGKNETSESERMFWNESGFEFTPYLIDVNGDDVNELAIKNYCAPVGNCQFWLFKKKGKIRL